MKLTALALIASAFVASGASSAKPAATTDWSRVTSISPEGGMVMGNPRAPVRLIEYGSMTCPHCRRFEQAGIPALTANYVRPGRVSFEFRNYVRDPFDLTAALIARCGGPASFFPVSQALFAKQDEWIARIQGVPKDRLTALQSIPEKRQFVEVARLAALPQYAAAHGVSPARSGKCLADTAAVERLLKMTGDATTLFPDLPGTPTFILNGKMLDKTATWDQLEPQLKVALGG